VLSFEGLVPSPYVLSTSSGILKVPLAGLGQTHPQLLLTCHVNWHIGSVTMTRSYTS